MMQFPVQGMNDETHGREAVPAIQTRELMAAPDFNTPLKPVADFVTRPDFPQCVLGEHLDLGGFTGVVVAVIKQSIKVRSADGATRSFKSYGLQRIYGAPVEVAPPLDCSPSSPEQAPAGQAEPAKAVPAREVIEEPNFEQSVRPIVRLLNRPDFPRSALGQQVDIGGYIGVVVEIADQSLKVRSREGTSRNYNLLRLRAIYGGRAGVKT